MNFPDTNWTLLAQATLSGDSSGARALGALLDGYRAPVVHFLRLRGSSPQDAEDLTQQLFLDIMKSRAWKSADRGKGRFRSFLLGILTHVVSCEQRRSQARKRGDGEMMLSLDELASEGLEPRGPSSQDVELFDKQWAFQLVTGGLKEVEKKFLAANRHREWSVLVRFLPGTGETPTYEWAAAELSMTLPALKTAVHRLRQQFRQTLRQAVAPTVSAADDIDDELAYLHRVLVASAR